MVIINNEFKIAQYGHCDGYLEGAGLDIINFIKLNFSNNSKLEEFKTKVSKLEFYSDIELEILKAKNSNYPVFYCENSNEILNLVLNNNITKVESYSDFASNSLFCEYGYVLNLDSLELEIYLGFNKNPVPKGERFCNFKKSDGDYYPIRFFDKISFDIIINGSETPKEIIKNLVKKEQQ
jgi:hypothetical protein